MGWYRLVPDDTVNLSHMHFHDILNLFCARQVTGTPIMDINMAQYMASTKQDPIFLFSLDLRKAYDTFGHGRILKNLEGYGVGPKLHGLLT